MKPKYIEDANWTKLGEGTITRRVWCDKKNHWIEEEGAGQNTFAPLSACMCERKIVPAVAMPAGMPQ